MVDENTPQDKAKVEQNSGSMHPANRDNAIREKLPLRDLFNRFLEEDFFLEPFDFTRNTRLATFINKQFIPKVDVSETDTHVKVIADVPGVDPDDIDIDVQHNRMRISGSSMRESTADERPFRYERTYGEFRREFPLPSEVKKDEVKASYKDGVLTITIPKAQEQRGEKIRIERG